MFDRSTAKAITPQMVLTFAKSVCQRIRLEGGGYHRDHLRALVRRADVAEGEVRIIESKTRLLQTQLGIPSVNSVPTQGLNWRYRQSDANPSLLFADEPGVGDKQVAPLAKSGVT